MDRKGAEEDQSLSLAVFCGWGGGDSEVFLGHETSSSLV